MTLEEIISFKQERQNIKLPKQLQNPSKLDDIQEQENAGTPLLGKMAQGKFGNLIGDRTISVEQRPRIYSDELSYVS